MLVARRSETNDNVHACRDLCGTQPWMRWTARRSETDSEVKRGADLLLETDEWGALLLCAMGRSAMDMTWRRLGKA